jgi:hypothetical protein
MRRLGMHPSTLAVGAAFLGQVVFAVGIKDVRPFWTIMPPPPTERELAVLSFGDPQLLYRRLVMNLQNFGDTGGRLTPLRDYDIGLVVGWMEALDTLDRRANHHLALAAHYFSQTQERQSLGPLVRYIMRHVDRDPPRKLQWIASALLMAEVRLKDVELQKDIADQIAGYDFPGMRPIAYQLPAVIYDRAGEPARAAELMEIAMEKLRGRVPDTEIRYMESFISAMRERAGRG